VSKIELKHEPSCEINETLQKFAVITHKCLVDEECWSKETITLIKKLDKMAEDYTLGVIANALYNQVKTAVCAWENVEEEVNPFDEFSKKKDNQGSDAGPVAVPTQQPA